LASSSNFDRVTSPQFKTAPRVLADPTRFRGYRGGVISMHRALARLVLTPLDRLAAVLLAVLFLLLWIVSLPQLCRFWRAMLAYGIQYLALPVTLGLRPHHVTHFIRFEIPFPRMPGLVPAASVWWWTAAVVLALFAATFLFSPRMIPVTYLLRAILAVQASALLYFVWLPARFPHTPDSYMEGLVTYGLAIISFVPLLFGLTYYIFDFGAGKKALLTAMTMLHLSVFLPLQILLQALVLHVSVLFMPLLYIVFGLPLDILIIIAFYSWAMSWSPKGIAGG
jgi:hypothetical protein